MSEFAVSVFVDEPRPARATGSWASVWARVDAPPLDRVWRWRVNLPERFGQRLRVLARGAMNSALIEFADGERHVVSRFAFRKAPA